MTLGDLADMLKALKDAETEVEELRRVLLFKWNAEVTAQKQKALGGVLRTMWNASGLVR